MQQNEQTHQIHHNTAKNKNNIEKPKEHNATTNVRATNTKNTTNTT
jgi:hypothetical protein